MSLKSYNPVTPSTRELITVDRSGLWKGRPFKSLTTGVRKTGGRNNFGRITCWNKGGGHRRLYREIDFKRNKDGVSAVVKRIEYDPNRTAFIALLEYEDGGVSYIIAPAKLAVGDKVISGSGGVVDIKVGNSMPLVDVPIGSFVHNVEMKPGKGGQIARSAGTFVQVVGKSDGYAQLKMKSGEVRIVHASCRCTIGVVSNSDHQNVNYGKAGRMAWKGVRPSVRGVAMNPVDHPHGGGEGKTSGGRHPVTPWGKPTKGKKTRNNKSTNRFIIRRASKGSGSRRG